MSRKALGVLVGVVGTLVALGTLIGMSLMGSLLADARSERIIGPGVDVFLRTPFPSPRDEVVLEVAARGGERAGIEQVTVREESRVLAEAAGAGATWGSTIRSSKTRGSESKPVAFRVPEGHPAGTEMSLTVEVAYVVAMTGGGGFTNESRRETVRMTIPVHSPAGRRLARLKPCGVALGIFAVWFLLVWGVAGLYARAEDRGGDTADPEFEGIGLLMGLLGGGFLGYWFFARRLMAVWGTQATGWAVLLTSLWVGLPLIWVWRWWRHRRRLGK